jgi:hypothetical protein
VLPSQAFCTESPSAKAISPLLQQVQVFNRRFGGLDLRLHALDLVAVNLGQRDTERIVDAGGAAGQHVDEFLRLGGD